MRILALDLGKRKVGLALSDPSGMLAQPLKTILRNKDFTAQLKQLIAEYEVERLVLGLPLKMDGSRGPAAKQVAQLAYRLSRELSLPVELHDERLTSQDADQQMLASGVKKKRRPELQDAIAAALILRSYLEEQKKHENCS